MYPSLIFFKFSFVLMKILNENIYKVLFFIYNFLRIEEFQCREVFTEGEVSIAKKYFVILLIMMK